MTNTFSVLKGGTSKSAPLSTARIPWVTEQIVDFSSTTFPNSGFPAFTPNTVTLSGNGAGDVAQAINIPAGFVVLAVGFEVLTADTAGNSGTVAISDGTTTFVAATAVQSTGIKSVDDVGAKLYTSPAVLEAVVGTGNINAVVRVFAIVSDVNAVDTYVYY